MTAIKPIGNFLSVDDEGYLINPCRYDLIVPPWSDVVEVVKTEYIQQLKEKVHSLYIRGSVAKGTAIVGISDIDVIAVIFGECQEIDESWIGAFQQRMAVKYPFQTGIELRSFVSHSEVCDTNRECFNRFVIKTQSVCIWGEDLIPLLPRYKLERYILCHSLYIKKDIQDLMEELTNLEDEETIKEKCQWLMKRLIRTGFELVMEKEQTYTRDLYPCYVAFCRHFPAQAQQMKYALERAIEPSGNKEELVQFMGTFGAWIVTTVTETFPETPKK